ncbi:hypothetical protein IFM89_033794 [Coptis chinensis]|uniref:Amino acid transporter transmembrane domain-containing protein n=1 Tax=Coptis chinensis TaxID=261450 RepID=A0A835LTR9_9MAGN|nr:hypothetical protein IFM89_033794 [Coptis chinensis]
MEKEGANEDDSKSNKVDRFDVESVAQANGGQNNDHGLTSAHTIDHDSWKQVGVLLVTTFNCGYILTFSNLMLVPLGWSWGVVCLILVGIFAAYANWLLAGFHIIGGQRFIRYRDLMGFVFGEYFQITPVSSTYTDTKRNVLPHMGPAVFDPSAWEHGLYPSWWKSTQGKTNKDRDYNIKGSQADKVFHAFGAIAAILVCNTSGLLPEIQSTLRKPVVKNMRKALYVQYTIGLGIYYGVSIVGYWAYGSSVSEYLPKELSGPKWGRVLINAMVFLQAVVSQHMFIAPIHEALDTKFLKPGEKMYSTNNLKRLFVLRALLFTVNTFITAAFPFMGDFVNLLGSFTLFPLTFVFPSMIFLKVKGNSARFDQKVWHWSNIVLFSLLAVITTVSAVRLIVNNAKMYNFFADT